MWVFKRPPKRGSMLEKKRKRNPGRMKELESWLVAVLSVVVLCN